jgi:hypothetical protein
MSEAEPELRASVEEQADRSEDPITALMDYEGVLHARSVWIC